MDVHDHPGFDQLGLYEQRLCELLGSSTRVEELLPDSDLLDLRAAVAVAAEARLALPDWTAIDEERQALVVCERGFEISNDQHSWSSTWSQAGGELSHLISGGCPPGPSGRIEGRRRVTFIDWKTLSTSDYGLRWAEKQHDLVISDWKRVLSRNKGKCYYFSAKLRSECETSWVIAPNIPSQSAFLLDEPGYYLLSLTDGYKPGRRSRLSGLALGPQRIAIA
jgi:hypothetical protein